MEREDIVAAIVSVAGGELVGRVRLQKTVYLLQRLGLRTDLPFEYHHYGPYSRELDNATGDANAFNLIKEELHRRQSDGATFSVFSLVGGVAINEAVFIQLGREKVGELVRKFTETNVTVLELAATVDWLAFVEQAADWRGEIVRRKGKKVSGGRLEQALDLLSSLGLQPPANLQQPTLI